MLLARLVSGIMPRKLRRTGRTKKQVTSDDKGSQKVDIDGIEEQERTMLRIALEEIKVQGVFRRGVTIPGPPSVLRALTVGYAQSRTTAPSWR